MIKSGLGILLLIMINWDVCGQDRDAFPVQTTLLEGTIEGNYSTRTGIQTYFGIPFAKPPVDSLRWKPPQPLEPWEGVKITKTFGPRPMQRMVFGDMRSRSAGVSEDCLYLNVWTPAKRNTTGLPVLVYFYGGGNVAGDASEYRYDGASMAQKGMVVVTANYRLNVFGYLAHPDLTVESPVGASGNYGSLDQVATLEWVRRNIAAFGGDPDKVTIAGESAGSKGVSTLMASPLSRNLIAGAIGESGAAIPPTTSPIPLAEAEAMGTEFTKRANVASIADLRRLPARDIYEIYNESGRFGFPLVMDGYFLSKSLKAVFEAGEQAQVPLLVGWNSAEMSAMAFMEDMPMTKRSYRKKVREVFPNDADAIMELYPGKNEEEVLYSATALASDRFIAYSTWKWFDLHRKNSVRPVFRYLYSKLRPPLVDDQLVSGLAGGTMKKDSKAAPAPKPIGAPHACEIEYALGNLPLVTEYRWTPDDYEVSRTMQDYFANFVIHGNPNGGDLPEWPAAVPDDPSPKVMDINVESGASRADQDGRYRFLDRLYGNNQP